MLIIGEFRRIYSLLNYCNLINFNFFLNKIEKIHKFIKPFINMSVTHFWAIFAFLIDILKVPLFSSEAYKIPGLQ